MKDIEKIQNRIKELEAENRVYVLTAKKYNAFADDYLQFEILNEKIIAGLKAQIEMEELKQAGDMISEGDNL